MRRRSAIKSLSAIALGISLFPSCSDGLTLDTNDPIKAFSKNQGVWIDAMSEAILPKKSNPISTLEPFPDFVVKMISYSESEKDFNSFFNGYNLCTTDIKQLYDTQVKKLTEDQIVDYFNTILDEQEGKAEEGNVLENENKLDRVLFCQTIRVLSIKHLTSSKEYQEQVLEYKLVPDKYESCVAI